MVPVRPQFPVATLACVIAALLAARPCPAEEPNERLRQLIADVEPSVVTIEVPGVAVGSGFVVTKDGVIATCYHVIEGAKEVRIKLHGGESLDAIGFIAVSPGKDIALLKVKTVVPLVPLPIANKDPSKGDGVVAFGAPRGFEGSVSNGIISSVRNGADPAIKKDERDADSIWVQTTTPISPGNSGGPLVDLEGNVVGINAWCRTDGQNLNFAASARQASDLLATSVGNVSSFANLPKPRETPERVGDAARTLAYWQRIAKARAVMDEAVGIESLHALTVSDNESATEEERVAQRLADRKEERERELKKRQKAFHKKHQKVDSTFTDAAEACKKYAAEIRKIDPTGVEIELTILATLDAERAGRRALAIRMLANLNDQVVRTGQLQIDPVTAKFISDCLSETAETNRSYDFMRLYLVAKYDLPFRPITEATREKPQPIRPAKIDKLAREKLTPEKLEEQAQKKLNLARSLMSAGKTSAANKRLSQIIADYPGTKAAETARSLLEEES